jgi:hypothetical protein
MDVFERQCRQELGDAWSIIDAERVAYTELLERAECLRRALHEIAEEWAGAECGEPVTAQEAYAIELARRMYRLAVEAGQ